jgi:hypothetical protein
MSLIKLVTSPYLWFFFMAMLGLWLVCWAGWGGEIRIDYKAPPNEAGLGLNP